MQKEFNITLSVQEQETNLNKVGSQKKKRQYLKVVHNNGKIKLMNNVRHASFGAKSSCSKMAATTWSARLERIARTLKDPRVQFTNCSIQMTTTTS